MYYSANPDTTVNANGRDLRSVCISITMYIMLINHLQIGALNRDGGLTFRRKDKWISKLGGSICLSDMLRHIQKHNVIQDLLLPTDNAALSLHIHDITPTAAEMLLFANH